MSQAARRKPKIAIQSTDRAGSVLLLLSVLVFAFAFMLILGIFSQTQGQALIAFKGIARGLGGPLHHLLPALLLWLGTLLMISSKRHASWYSILIAVLLYLCLGALISLLSNVGGYASLMKDIFERNAIEMTGADPGGFGAYLSSGYHRAVADPNNGGALAMLLAHPLYASIGQVGGAAVLILATILLVFAFIRQNPVKLIERAMDRRSEKNRPHQDPRVAAQGPGEQRIDSPATQGYAPQEGQSTQPAWPAAAHQEVQLEPLGMNHQYPLHGDGFTQPGKAQAASYQQGQLAKKPEPGFVQHQEPDLFDFQTQPVQRRPAAYKPAQAAAVQVKNPNPVVDQANTLPMHEAGHQPSQAAIAPRIDQGTGPQTPIASEPLVSPVDAPVAAASNEEPAHTTARNRRRTKHQSEPLAASEIGLQPQLDAKPQPAPKTIKAENTQAQGEEKPAPLETKAELPPQQTTAAKPKPAAKPGYTTTMDGMAKRSQDKQLMLALDDYQVPPIRLLTENPDKDQLETTAEDRVRADRLLETLDNFAIKAHLHDIVHGPTVTRFAIRLAEGVNVSKLRNVMDNLAIELKVRGDIRAEIPIPGTSYVGLEVSNDNSTKVMLRDVLDSPRMREAKSPTAVALGKDITGTPIPCELMDMPHLLIAGATGSGKSVCINSIICSILYRASPRHVRMIMIDPKFVELHPYNEVPHLLMPVITDAKKANLALDYICQQMDERYQIMVKAGVRNLDAYNKSLPPDAEPLPRIIVIVDEMADLMTTSGKEIEDHIKRITAKARAAGICLILATQRPSVNVITGVIKANIPGRIAFKVSSPFDSKTILDSQGAEKLLGKGDMLFRSSTREPIRVQGCFVSDSDVEQTVNYIKSRNKAEYDPKLIEYVEKPEQAENGSSGDGGDEDGAFDELLPQAIEMAVESGQMSISMLQRVLRIGYARSGRLIDEMDRRGIISGNEGTKPRRTLMTREQYMSYLEEQETL